MTYPRIQIIDTIKVMNFLDDLIFQTLKALRGDKSQNWVSTRMGFNYNIVSRWEAGRRSITWNEFTKFCQTLKVDTLKSLQTLYPEEKFLSDTQLFNRLIANKEHEVISEIIHCSKSTLYRLKSGEQEVPLKSILRLMEYNGDTIRFFQSLLPFPEKVPTLTRKADLSKKARALFAKQPLVSPLLLFLETKTYLELNEHSDALIAKRFKLSTIEVQSILQKLTELELVYKQSEKYHPYSKFINLGWSYKDDIKEIESIERFWIDQMSLSYDQEPLLNRKTVGFVVFNSNKEALKKTKIALKNFSEQMHQILTEADKEPSDSQCILHYQLAEFQD